MSLPTSEAASAAPLVRAPSDGLLAKMVAGGLSCMLISSLLNPMDVVKIRLQTQNQLNAGPATVGHSHSLLPAASLAQQQAAVHSSHRASPLHLSMYADSKYKGMTDGLLTIYREESYGRGLMRGSVRLEHSSRAALSAAIGLAGSHCLSCLLLCVRVCASAVRVQCDSQPSARGVVQQCEDGAV